MNNIHIIMTIHNDTGNHSNTTLYLYLDVTPNSYWKQKKQTKHISHFFLRTFPEKLEKHPQNQDIYIPSPPKKNVPIYRHQTQAPKNQQHRIFFVVFCGRSDMLIWALEQVMARLDPPRPNVNIRVTGGVLMVMEKSQKWKKTWWIETNVE